VVAEPWIIGMAKQARLADVMVAACKVNGGIREFGFKKKTGRPGRRSDPGTVLFPAFLTD